MTDMKNFSLLEYHDDDSLDKLAQKIKTFLPVKSCEMIDRCLELYHRHEFVILIAGEISVGKSSFLNALMGYPVLLMDQTETTAAITYLRSAEKNAPDHPNQVKINYIDGRHEWFSIHDHEKMKIATTSLNGNKQAIRTVRSAEVYLSADVLPIPPGITIIDTPGLNGSSAHSDLTHAEMGLCHVALFLLDATKFGTLSNQEEFQRLYRYAPELLFVVNMWDKVRNASTRSIDEVKREDYMPKLCNWAGEGEVTDSNIFVVSNKEAMNVMSRYVNLTDEEKKDITPAKMLEKEHPDNDFFFLFAALNKIMKDQRKKQLMQIRPIQTMMSVVQDHLLVVSQQMEKFNEAEIEQKIELEQLRIQKQQDELKDAYELLRQSAIHLADYETSMYKNLLEENSHIVTDLLTKKIDGIDANKILDDGTTSSVREWLNCQIKQYFETPLQQRFQAFISYLKKILESQVQIKAGENISLGSASALQDNFTAITQQRDALNREITSLSSEQTSIQSKIDQINRKLARCHEEFVNLQRGKIESARLKQLCDDINEQITDLGLRPAIKHWDTNESYTHDNGCGFLWLRSLFGTRYETRYRKVHHSDDSAQRKWDAEKGQLEAKLTEAKQKYINSLVDESQVTKLRRDIESYEKEIKRHENELDDIKSKEEARRTALKNNFSPLTLKRQAVVFWCSEVKNVLSRYNGLLLSFKENVDNLLKSFWEQREKNVQKYISTLSVHEKALFEEQKKKSAEYHNLQNHEKILKEAMQELQKLQAKYVGTV